MAYLPFRFGVVSGQARTAEGWLASARRAEELGFSSFLIPDTLGQTFAPIPALAAIVAATQRLRVGTYVLANDFRNPVLLAGECATIDFLSDGRFELGIGVGRPGVDHDNRKLGIATDAGGVRVSRLTESIRIIKSLLQGQVVSTTGTYYSVDGADTFPKPVQRPHLPILIAGAGSRLLALAAREADIIALALPPETGEAVFKQKVAEVAEAAGDRFDKLELNFNLVSAGDQIPPWFAHMGVDPVALARAGSPAVLTGSVDTMCDQLLRQRESLGISYITLGEFYMEALAPVVERLAGK
jgi:probable F420-dependent oxidoreductase